MLDCGVCKSRLKTASQPRKAQKKRQSKASAAGYRPVCALPVMRFCTEIFEQALSALPRAILDFALH